MPNYKLGKVVEAMEFSEFLQHVAKANLPLEQEAYIWLLYYCGVRKSEGFERVFSDIQITPEFFIIDFHQRKKNGSTVPPLELPRKWPGVEELIQVTKIAAARKPLTKMLFYYEKQERKSRIEKNQWLFPNIQSTVAWRIVKRTLGPRYYPHFLRLNRITELCGDPNFSLSRLKSFTGIKSLDALQSYLGVSRREQKESLAWMDKHIKPEEGN